MLRTAITAVAVLGLVLAAGGLAVRSQPVTNHLTLIVAALSPYFLALTPVAVLLLVVTRRWTLTALATALSIAVIIVYVPYFRHIPAPAGVKVRVMTANLFEGAADAATLVSRARLDADVLAVQELTGSAVSRLTIAGLDAEFPFRWVDPRSHADGIGLWSRYPLSATWHIPGLTMSALGVRLRIPGVASDPALITVHIAGPWPQPIDGWRSDLAQLPGIMRRTADEVADACVIVAGDFNSTSDMRQFRDLSAAGYADAGRTAGAGLIRSYPANSTIPPFIGIDHILTSRCQATTLRTVPTPGSDHRGLVADVLVPS